MAREAGRSLRVIPAAEADLATLARVVVAKWQ